MSPPRPLAAFGLFLVHGAVHAAPPYRIQNVFVCVAPEGESVADTLKRCSSAADYERRGSAEELEGQAYIEGDPTPLDLAGGHVEWVVGETLVTLDARAMISTPSGGYVVVDRQSRLHLAHAEHWELLQGHLLAELHRPVEVGLGESIAAVTGTRFVVGRREGEASAPFVEVLRGEVEVRPAQGPPWAVRSGARLVLTEEGPVQLRYKGSRWAASDEGQDPGSTTADALAASTNREPDTAAALGTHLDGGSWGRWGPATWSFRGTLQAGYWDWQHLSFVGPTGGLTLGGQRQIWRPLSVHVDVGLDLLIGAEQPRAGATASEGAARPYGQTGLELSIGPIVLGAQGALGVLSIPEASCDDLRLERCGGPTWDLGGAIGFRRAASRFHEDLVRLELGKRSSPGDRTDLYAEVVLALRVALTQD